MDEWEIEEPAIVSANDAPAYEVIEAVFQPPSPMPIVYFASVSVLMIGFTYFFYTKVALNATSVTGENWRGLLYSQ